jgi:hypothetical protein
MTEVPGSTVRRLALGETIQGEIRAAFSLFGWGSRTREHWLHVTKDVVWLCLNGGRVGVCVARVAEGNNVSFAPAGPAPLGRAARTSGLPPCAFTIVRADGTLASGTRYTYASAAAEAAIRFAWPLGREVPFRVGGPPWTP